MIRKFNPSDTKQIMRIWLEGNIEAHDFVPEEYWISNYNMVAKQLLQADVYVYEIDNQIQGFAGMVGNYLAGIFVDGRFRSTGIGKSLLEHIKRLHSLIELNVYKENQRAVDFYLREGFSIVSEGVDEATEKIEYAMELTIG